MNWSFLSGILRLDDEVRGQIRRHRRYGVIVRTICADGVSVTGSAASAVDAYARGIC